jgi:glycosyltransferase involved in cell wall biosynthesis
MRILMLHNRYLIPGGEDQSAAAETVLLRDAGHEVELLEQDNRAIEQIGKVRTAWRTLWSAESHRAIARKLGEKAFDVLHVQNFFPLWSPSVYYAAQSCGVAVVQTLRNYRLLCVNATLFRDGKPCEDCVGRSVAWPGVRHACYRRSRVGSAVVASMIGLHKARGTWKNKVDVYVALTEFARGKYIQGGLPEEKIIVKPNFVYPSPPAGPGGGGYAIFVGRLSPEKGIAALLEAWRAAANPLPLKIVGDGPLADVVKAAATASSKIELLGRKSPEETFALVQQAELLVFPSEWYEGMPRTVIEAFAAGTPVVASNLGAMATMLEPGKTGFVFPAGDVPALAKRMEWCSQNLAQVRSLRPAARAEFESKYTGAANLELLLEIYRRARQAHLPCKAVVAAG